MAKKAIEPTTLSSESTNAQLNVCRLASGQIDYDRYRRAGLEAVESYTKIPLIVYATDFQSGTKVRACQGQVGIDSSDVQGFNEVIREIPSGPLDVMLHTPGGSAEAAESIVKILHKKDKGTEAINALLRIPLAPGDIHSVPFAHPEQRLDLRRRNEMATPM